MSDSGAAEIVRRYGLWPLLGAIPFALVIWAMCHWFASPGTKVSILWGLAEYTKHSVARSSKDPVVDRTSAGEDVVDPKSTTASELAGIDDVSGDSGFDLIHQVDDGRIFVSISPLDLIKELEGLTRFKAQRVVEPYKGKWMRAKASIRNVSQYDDGEGRVTIAFGDSSLWDGTIVVDANEFEKISHADRGDILVFEGRIEDCSASGIDFDVARIVSVEQIRE